MKLPDGRCAGFGFLTMYSLEAMTNSKRLSGKRRHRRSRRDSPENEMLLTTPVRMPNA